MPGNHSSSNSSSKTHRRVLFRGAPGNWCEQRAKVLQQTTQNGASGNRCEVLGRLLRKKSQNLKSVDLRIEESAQDVILKDQERTDQLEKVVEQNTNWIPCKESSRTIHDVGNIQLHELGQISGTVQCQYCLKHVPEGLIFCSCGICLRPDEEQIQRIKPRC